MDEFGSTNADESFRVRETGNKSGRRQVGKMGETLTFELMLV